MLYRLFPIVPGAGIRQEGGPLFVPRLGQGGGRHDAPGLYGTLYCSRTMASTVAEQLRWFQGAELTARDLTSASGSPLAIAHLDESDLEPLVDLDEPAELSRRELRPSMVATGDRETTQAYAARLFAEGISGFEWWSTVEASWINVTLFAERAVDHLRLAADPDPISIDHPAVREAADVVGVSLA